MRDAFSFLLLLLHSRSFNPDVCCPLVEADVHCSLVEADVCCPLVEADVCCPLVEGLGGCMRKRTNLHALKQSLLNCQ